MKGKTANILILMASVLLVILLFIELIDITVMLFMYAVIFGILGVMSKGFRKK